MKSLKQIPVAIYSYSKPLIESVHFCRKEDNYVVQGMKDNLKRGEVKDFRWIDTQDDVGRHSHQGLCQVRPVDGRAQDHGDAAALLGARLQ